jgi:peptidoglycan/LPS O-acetylase OafA/YrhL
MKRLDFIDFYRGIAILMVVVCHNLQFGDNTGLSPSFFNLFEAGKHGVQLFFILSALTIFLSIESRRKREDKAFLNFFIRRFLRIAPMYYVAVFAYAYLNGTSSTGVILNLTFLHGFSPDYINSVVPGGWSVGIEMVFYLLCPFLFVLIRNINHSFLFLGATLLFSFATRYLLINHPLHPNESNWASFLYFFLPNQLPIFALGIAAYFTFKHKQLKEVSPGMVFFIALIALLGAFSGFDLFPKLALIGIALVSIVLVSTPLSFTSLPSRAIVLTGKISYSLYLVHYLVFMGLEKVGFNQWNDQFFQSIHPLLSFFSRLVVALPLAASIAYITYHLIERTGISMGNRIIEQIEHKEVELIGK